MPVRVIRNIMNRFWGGGGAAAAEDSSEEDENREALADEGGVD